MNLHVKQCLGSLTMLVVEGASEVRHFRQLYNHVFWSPQFHQNASAMRVIFFFENTQNLI